jgi:hypothetical protein
VRQCGSRERGEERVRQGRGAAERGPGAERAGCSRRVGLLDSRESWRDSGDSRTGKRITKWTAPVACSLVRAGRRREAATSGPGLAGWLCSERAGHSNGERSSWKFSSM